PTGSPAARPGPRRGRRSARPCRRRRSRPAPAPPRPPPAWQRLLPAHRTLWFTALPTVRRSRSRWAGVAPEDRRAERRALLVQAAFELLGTEGWQATTVRAVCQRAALNPRYFYESFHDLDELLVAVYDAVLDELRTAVLTAI